MKNTAVAPWLEGAHWPTVPIRLVARLGSGHTPSRSVPKYWDNCTVPWITLADVWQLRSGTTNFIRETKEKISTLGLANSAAVKHPAGTVILSRTASVGFSAIMGADMATSQDFATWTCGPKLDPRYLLHSLRAMAPDLKRIATGSTHKTIYMPDIEQLRVPVPPMDEQRRIADFLDAETARIDRLTVLRKSQVHCIEEQYFNTISEYTTPGVTSNAARSGQWPWLPAAVEVARLGYFARVQGGVTVHGARTETPEDAEYPYLRVANVQNGAIDLSEVKSITIPSSMAKQASLRDGDVVITEANGNPNNLGRGAVWHNEIPGMVHQNHVFAIRVNKERLLPEYVAILLASLHGRHYFRFTSSQVGIATTSSSKVLDFPIPLTVISRQKQVIDKCESARLAADQAVKLLQRQLELVTERRQALITAAVTGQIDVSTASGRGIEE
ncbi:restriction endonuclease subunit S [Streptomyces jumonjinensis]|uniref:restriction endonuclease subunit S n=1 Tax=Streptomyces jumonjinensis TaxID=1945 RepID=UPI0037995FCD